MKIEKMLVWGALIAGAYLVFKGTSLLKTATEPVSQGIANLWMSMTSSPRVRVLGNVVSPSGVTIGALADMTVKKDSSGNVYARSRSGNIYQLSPSDARGNWPGRLVGSGVF